MSISKIPIIYITSNGRSGSTLLELLLNAHDNIWSMGEVYALPWEVKEQRGFCGCGKKIPSCEFWSPVINDLRDILSVPGNISKFRDTYKISKFFHAKEFRLILMNKTPRAHDCTAFYNDNALLFSTVKKFAELFSSKSIKYLVDASKNYYRLFYLLNCSHFNLKIIHIVKDPRAFIYSWIRNTNDPKKYLGTTIRMSLRYIYENALIERIINNKSTNSSLFLRYEDLALNPRKELERICTWLGIDLQTDIIENFRDAVNHGIAGNFMRHQQNKIQLDKKWLRNLNWMYKMIGLGITFPWAKKYGYLSF